MFDGYLRAVKDHLLRPVARAIGPGFAPNLVSWAAFIVGMLATVAVAQGRLHVGLALWLSNRLLDGLDGALAREHGRASAYGGYLDIVLDFVVYASIPIGLVVWLGRRDAALMGMLLLGTFYVNAASWMYLAAVLEKQGVGAASRGELTTVTMPAGLVAGTETIAFYILFLLFPMHAVPLFGVMAALVLLTVVQRLLWARRNIREPAR